VKVIKLPGNKMTERLSNARFDSIDIPELIGLCRGVLADGTINLAEAEFILQWLNERSNVLQTWPADELHRLLCTVLADGTLCEDEETELSGLLEEVIGDPVSVLIY
jgi:hypothetical protein